MTTIARGRRRRFGTDILLALILGAGLSFAFGAHTSDATPAAQVAAAKHLPAALAKPSSDPAATLGTLEMAAFAGQPAPAATPWDAQGNRLAILLAALATAAMFTFNLALIRHLRRVHASPRRGSWRRG